MRINNKFAIGCLVQWYEIEMIEEYINSVKQSLEHIENKENVIVDFKLVINQDLEKIDESQITMDEIITRFEKMIDGFELDVTEELVTIADYRRWFNDYYCDKVDVLMWGETDALIPKQTFQILDNLHNNVKDNTPKYTTFFSTCKMWDDSWKVLEHPEFTDKPFYDKPEQFKPEHWWSLRYTMNKQEMDKHNANMKKLSKVLKKVNLYEDLKSRLDEVIFEYNNNLSGGQLQRMAIARALYRDSKLVIFDEPISNLDTESAKQVIKVINNLKKDRIVIIVSHSLIDEFNYDSRIEL